VVSRYRALLIGNSTYLTDEHNLQALKGPVKDIAALNRALIDPRSGLFEDADVSLLPEATSDRAVRALGRFFGTATRDDVLLLYFSGHGKLDQAGRLHLCMQDTDTSELLSTAVSSARVNEFADASRARNVVIVLDCCHAGAFRGADLGQAVAGPGRYVMTSCRGTQLANDATVENGTSLFTQYLVDALVSAAADQDGDGYVTFSDLYAYVDRQLREAGKQIPQRRVDADGDLPLAKRPQAALLEAETATPPPADQVDAMSHRPAQAGPEAGSSSGSTRGAAGGSAPDGAHSPRLRQRSTRRRWAVAVAGAVMAVGGVVAAILLLAGGAPTTGPTTNANTYTATAPWRLKVDATNSHSDNGCTINVTDANSGSRVLLLQKQYGTSSWQIHQTGSFRWNLNDPGCLVAPNAGSGTDSLPLAWPAGGDSDAFATRPRLTVQVTDYAGGQQCQITLRDPTNGEPIDFGTATKQPAKNTLVLNAGGHATAYLSDLQCGVRVSAAP
jgi:hypothetical protein